MTSQLPRIAWVWRQTPLRRWHGSKDEKRRTQTLRTIKGARESRRHKAEHTRGFKLLPTVSKQLDSGQIDHALKTAQSIKDITARATAYAKIAHVHARAGRLADAFSVVERIEPKKQYLAEQQIASLWAHEKTISGNLRFAESLSNQKWRDVALGYVALSQAVAGRRAQASRTIDKITDDSYWRSNAVQQIIEHHTHKGNETEMAFWLTRVRGGLAKFKAYMRISLVREKAGNRKAAIDWALKARDELQRTAKSPKTRKQLAHPWGGVGFYVDFMCSRLVKLGLFEEAFKTAKIHPDPSLLAILAYSVASERVKRWKYDEALKTLDRIADAEERRNYKARLWGAIAQIRAESGNIAAGKGNAKTNKPDRSSDRALSALVDAKFKAGKIAEALAAAKKISNSRTPLRNVIRRHTKAGNFAFALQLAEIIIDRHYRNSEMTIIARAQAKAGQARAALATADKIKSWNPHRIYQAIAESFPN